MNETIAEAPIAARLPLKRKKQLSERAFLWIVGSNELDVVQRHSPYYPDFNLIPRKPLPTFLVVAIGSLVLGGFIALTAFLILNSLVSDTEIKFEELKREIAFQQALQKMIEKADQRKVVAESQLQLFKAVQERLFSWSNALDVFRCLTPCDVRLTSLKADNAGQVLADGQSYDLSSIGFLMLNLRGSGLFYKPKLYTSQLEEVGNRKIFRFTLSSELLNPVAVLVPLPEKVGKAKNSGGAP